MKKLLLYFIVFHISLLAQGQENSYTPFVEEGKVWKVGWFPGIQYWAQRLDYYYFDGDTIINRHMCKVMKCRHESKVEDTWTEYIGGWYEHRKQVYCVFPGKESFELIYDFGAKVGEEIEVYNSLTGKIKVTIYGRDAATREPFIGMITNVLDQEDFMVSPWMEGVGGTTPLDNIIRPEWAGYYYALMNCMVGDKVLYLENHYKDGIKSSMIDSPNNPVSLYDLSGRRLSTPPARGFFIQDGKKVVR